MAIGWQKCAATLGALACTGYGFGENWNKEKNEWHEWLSFDILSEYHLSLF